MTVSRRAALGLVATAAGALAAGCGRTVHSAVVATSGDRAAGPAKTAVSPSGPAGTSSPAVPGPAPATPRATTAAGGPAVEYANGPRNRPAVALTFHGAGDPAIAAEWLDVLATHRALVTVLAVGTWLADNPRLARSIVAAGHELGNHTYSHLDINALDIDAARAEIVRCRDLLVAQVRSAGALFRPSQTQHATPLVRRLAGAAGYRICLSYDIDSLDYTDPGPTAVRANVAAAQPGSVVSLHLGHPGTVAALPGILSDLAARGLRPVTASALLAG